MKESDFHFVFYSIYRYVTVRIVANQNKIDILIILFMMKDNICNTSNREWSLGKIKVLILFFLFSIKGIGLVCSQ